MSLASSQRFAGRMPALRRAGCPRYELLNALMKSGQLTGAQKGAIESCAAQWN
ncbi:MAG TPA: hypothetical protein VNA69_11785 [Thermoanaerobaculia bacterium]|nr:hypothetical protein [Thermoanaerobaculia bacterium]